MENNSPRGGVIITFYSYKGGTGRSMAVANTACLLAQPALTVGKKVLVMDWDLEAPGLHKYFPLSFRTTENARRPGVIDYFHELHKHLRRNPGLHKELIGPGGWELLDNVLPLQRFLVKDVVTGVDFVKAGKVDKSGKLGSRYAALVNSFSWASFYEEYGQVIDTFRELLSAKYSYSLIDSRTGLTDVSGICTMLLPEKLVAVFTPNSQSLYGLLDFIEEAAEYRRSSDDFRPLAVFPLPSRIELAEKTLRERWRKDYQGAFEGLFRRLFHLDECDLTAYLDEVQLPHVSYYAYGENIAVREERDEALSLSRAYTLFFDRLTVLDYAWETSDELPPSAAKGTSIDTPLGEKKYDCYLSYSTVDEKLVGSVAHGLLARKVKPFFLKWVLRPGVNWREVREEGVAESKSYVIFLGRGEQGASQSTEIQEALRKRSKDRSIAIIPVMLPGASHEDVPELLQSYVWVDFTAGITSKGLDDLAWGVTGIHPNERT